MELIWYVKMNHVKDGPTPEFTLPSDFRIIRITYLMMIGTYWGSDPFRVSEHTYHDILTVAHRDIIVSRPRFIYYKGKHAVQLAEILTDMRVPEFVHEFIFNQIYSEVALSDYTYWPVDCTLMDVTMYPQMKDDQCVAYQLKCCEKVRIDSLEDGGVKKQCIICWDTLDHLEGVEEGTDYGQLVRLPCSHLYHEECIVQWLKVSKLCPVCRYLMLPVVEHAFADVEPSMRVLEHVMEEVSEPLEPSWQQRHWPMLLTATVRGILTALLVCRLSKQS